MNAHRYCVLAVVLCTMFCATNSQADYVRASRTAIVRENPESTAREIARLERDDELNLSSDGVIEGSYYAVLLADGRTGFVSRFRVRRFEGLTDQIAPPLADPGVGLALSHREQEYAAFHFAGAGKPKGYVDLVRQGYTVGYDPSRKIPMWVQYRLTRERSENDIVERPDDFKADASIPSVARSLDSDYLNSGYNRGHMAPADDLRFDANAALEGNLLTNIAPQIGSSFNSSVWKTLESNIRSWVLDRRDLIVVMGPVFEARPAITPLMRQPDSTRQMLYNVVGENDVAVPTGFFKVIVDLADPTNPDVLAFLMPHIETVPGPERSIATYLTSVDNIEALTGLDLLPGLADTVENRVEAEQAQNSW